MNVVIHDDAWSSLIHPCFPCVPQGDCFGFENAPYSTGRLCADLRSAVAACATSISDIDSTYPCVLL